MPHLLLVDMTDLTFGRSRGGLARHLRRRAPYATAILYTHTLTTVRCYHPALLHGYIVSTVVVHVVTVVPAALLAVPAGLLGPPVS